MASMSINQHREIALTPTEYLPNEFGNRYNDDVSDYSASHFKSNGVRCGCSGKVYHNKYTFVHNHTKTLQHIQWLQKLVKDKPKLLKDSVENANQIKRLKIQVGKVDQENFQLKQKIKDLESSCETLRSENDELNETIRQQDEYMKTESTELEEHRSIVADLRKKLEYIEKGASHIMTALGFEVYAGEN